VARFGVLGVLTVFVSGVNRLFSFRMGEVVVKLYGRGAGARRDRSAPRGGEGRVLVRRLPAWRRVCFLVLVAPLAALCCQRSTAPRRCSAVRRVDPEWAPVLNGHRRAAGDQPLPLAGADQPAAEPAGGGMIVWAYLSGGGLLAVLWAYLVGKIILGLGPEPAGALLAAARAGPRLAARPVEPAAAAPRAGALCLQHQLQRHDQPAGARQRSDLGGVFLRPTVAGYFKTALAVMTLIIMPINPFISTTYPEITRAFASRAWAACARCCSASR
jgi:hypothetical protein